jgi:hypothetical protein
MRYLTGTAACLTLCFLACAPAVWAKDDDDEGAKKHGPETSEAVKHDTSPRLDHMHPAPINPQTHDKPLRPLPKQHPDSDRPDSAIQTKATLAPAISANSGLNILGVGNGFAGPQGSYSVSVVPSDSNGAAGPTQYVQWVNTSLAVFDKNSGTVLYGPVAGNTLWSGFGGSCETDNDGDILAKFDRAAGRWVMAQLAVASGPPYYECLAVSSSADALGAYFRYAFQFPDINDYPKLGIWSDAYYASYNMFPGEGGSFLGAKVCAMDRAKMIQGLSATQQCFDLSPTYNAVLPSDLDGATPPPVASPGYFVGIASDSLNLWRFSVDFTTPANSRLSGPVNLPVAPYSLACNGGGTCIPQAGTRQKLDSLGDRLMYRLAYRNFGDHDAMVVNHTVTAGSSTGVRWYEIRNPGGTPVVYQQGTYAPDSSFRWMGSIAMDKVGDIAMGYSVSSTQINPAIRYTGRVPADPLGVMQSETSLVAGAGSQLPVFGTSLSRWGDYTSLAVDPTDDCTFWYTDQYLTSNGDYNWSTRIGSFVFPSCAAAPPVSDFSLAVTPSSQTIARGSSAGYTLTVTPSGGFTGTLSFSATGLPPGVSAGFNPGTITTSGSTVMTVTTAPNTFPGNYPITISGTDGIRTHSVTVTLSIYIPGAALFVNSDTLAQGTWKGVYGADGLSIANDATSYPVYAQVALSGQQPTTWAASTTDVRALQKGAPAATDRIASAWWTASSANFDLNLVDGNWHRVAFYCLDWDVRNRSERFDVIDLVTGTVLDTRNISGFSNGQYLFWNLRGDVRVRVTLTGGDNAVVSGFFFDPQALPDFSISASPASQTVARGSSVNYNTTVTPQLGFSGAVTFSATGLPAGATASFNPASVTGGGSSVMTFTAGAATPSGSYTVTITSSSGSLTHSTTVTASVAVPVAAGASFSQADTQIQGTWKGVYGADGFSIANDVNSYPAYAQVVLSGQQSTTWAASTTDVRALQKGAPAATDRIAATWLSNSTFNLDLSLVDGNWHRVGFYCLDWDAQNRTERFDVIDLSNGAALDTRNISSFSNGQYLIWNLRGNVRVRVTYTGAGANAVVSGLFFDPPSPPDFSISASPSSQTVAQGHSVPYTATAAALLGFNGSVTFNATGLPAGATASFNPASVTGGGSSVMTFATGAATPSGSYTITITGSSGSLTHSTTVTAFVAVPVAAGASFSQADAQTQGTWKGVYGADGFSIANDVNSYPAYAQVALSGQQSTTWAASTSDVRALQKGAPAATDRIAATWLSNSNFNIDLNLLDGNWHRVGFYCLDWDAQNRTERFDIIDLSSGAVLDTRNISGFSSGQYLIWNLRGNVRVRVTYTGAGANAVVSGLFFDPPSPPDFSISASPGSQTVVQGHSVAYTATAAALLGFNGSVTFSATGLPAGATVSFNPASVTGGGSSSMTLTAGAGTPSGSYTITITGSSGSLTHSTTVTAFVAVPVAAGVSFSQADTQTQGTWKGVYGADGFSIANDVNSYPGYAQVALSGQLTATWTASTTDVRALQKGAPAATDRIAATWLSNSNFNIDLNLVDGNWHRVGFYCLDWDAQNRTERFDIIDLSSGAVLDTRNISGFSNGQYLIWNLRGNVRVRVTYTGTGANAVVSGLFFDPPSPPDFSISASPASQTVGQGRSTSYTATVTPLIGFNGNVTFNATGLPTGATASFNPTSVTGGGATSMTLTAGAATPTGTYTVTITGSSGSLTHSTSVTLVVALSVVDTQTQGSWKGVYGADGFAIANDVTNYPAYAQVTLTAPTYTWAASTTDVRALQKGAPAATDRIASTWVSNSSFNIDINFLDGNSHPVAFYCLDWDARSRAERFDIIDLASGTVLDSRTVSGFTNGQYLIWNLQGNVRVRVTLTGGDNAVVSGIFFN